MLRTRVLTALALLPAAWLLVFHATGGVFMVVTGALLLVGTWEFHRLADLDRPFGLLLLGVQAVLLAALALYPVAWAAQPGALFQLACLAWLILFMQLYFYRPGQAPDTVYRLRSTLNALGVITFGWMAVNWLHAGPAGGWWLTTLLLIIWAADIGAYFAGRALGKRKLAPAISPGKTREGLLGGLLLAALTGALAALLLPDLQAGWAPLALLAVVTAAVSAGGDLFISMHKRTVGLKDCGRLFPGHGGVLDRMDSLLAGAPFFALGKLMAGL